MKYRIHLIFIVALLLLYTLPAAAQPRIVSTIAGQVPVTPGHDSCSVSITGLGGAAHNSFINSCYGVRADTNNNVFFNTLGGTLRIDATTGILSRIAGGGSDATWSDTIPATAINHHFRRLCLDHSGNILLSNISIIRVNPSTGYFDVVAGLWPPVPGYTGDGGAATIASTNSWGLATDPSDNIYFVDHINSVLRRVDASTGIITTVAGDGVSSFSGDGGLAASARFNKPVDITFDTANNIYIADRDNFRVRKIDAITGIITTIAGAGGTAGDFSGMGGPATAALINKPICLTFDDTGYLYISVRSPTTGAYMVSDRILRLNLNSGIINQWGGGIMTAIDPGYPGDGKDVDSAWFFVEGMCFDTSGNMLISDNRCRLRKVWMPIPDGPGPIDTTTVDTTDTTGTTYVHTAGRSGMRIYPNPTRSELHIGNAGEPASFTLYTITGVPALQGALAPKEEHTLSLQQYPPGIYLLHVQQQNGERMVVRVLKE